MLNYYNIFNHFTKFNKCKEHIKPRKIFHGILLFRHFWIFPVIALFVWWCMLGSLLILWCIDGRPRYNYMDPNESLAYISEIGASRIKLIFVLGTSIQAFFYTLTIFAEHFLRRAQYLPALLISPQPSIEEEEDDDDDEYYSDKKTRLYPYIMSILSIFFGLCGQISLILLSIFDTATNHTIHVYMLILFLITMFLSCILDTNKMILMHKRHPNESVIKFSVYFRCLWITVGVILATAFAWMVIPGMLLKNRNENLQSLLNSYEHAGAVIEWVLAFWYGAYLLNLAYDLFPAISYITLQQVITTPSPLNISSLPSSCSNSNNNNNDFTYSSSKNTKSFSKLIAFNFSKEKKYMFVS